MNIEKFIKDDLEIRVVSIDKGEIELNLEDTCRGLGFVDTSKGTNKIIWNRVEKYICDITATQVSPYNRNGYIPEWIFYMLCVKAKNDKAKKFQLWVCKDILPSIRKNSYYIDEKNINKEQFKKLENDYLRMKEYFFNLCDMGKISLGRASELIFGNESELKKRLINLGWLDYEKCEFKQQRFKSSNGNIYELFVCNVSGIYKNGIVKHNLQVSITNAGYVYLKDKFEKDVNLGVVREE